MNRWDADKAKQVISEALDRVVEKHGKLYVAAAIATTEVTSEAFRHHNAVMQKLKDWGFVPNPERRTGFEDKVTA